MNKVDIANQSLVIIGLDPITSFEDGSTEADLVNVLYDPSLETLLQEHPWNFALGRVTLARLAAAPEYGFTYRYQLPSDCLQVQTFENEEYDYTFVVEDDAILTDLATCRITYTKYIEDMNKLSPSFRLAFIAFLASQLAPYTTNSAPYTQGAAAQYMMAIAKAKTLNARESRRYENTDGSWVTARITGGTTWQR